MSAMTALRRAWLPVLTVVALALGAYGIWRVHESSASVSGLAISPAQAPEEFTPKRLSYEVFGDAGGGGIVSYLDLDGHPHRIDVTELPWTHSETTTLTVVSGSVSVQVRGDSLGCRILVNDVVRDEQAATRSDADVTCRVKSA